MNKLDKEFEKGVKLLKENKLEASLKVFSKLIESTPDRADFYSERGVVYFHMNKRNESLADMDKAVELEPLKSYRYSSRAFIRGHFKDIDNAIKDYQKAVELDPEDAIAHNNLGLLEEQLGYHKQAKDRYKIADDLSVDGRSDKGLQGEEIKARNIQKEIDEAKEKSSFLNEIKSLGSKEGRNSFLRFIKSGFKEV
ncbi:MAG: tetratricopeptide repeat protein [Vicingaceae bacterium]